MKTKLIGQIQKNKDKQKVTFKDPLSNVTVKIHPDSAQSFQRSHPGWVRVD